MAAKVSNTNQANARSFIAVYGASGVGKTSLLVGLDNLAKTKNSRALQIDFDDGNLSLQGHDIVSVSCDYMADAYAVMNWVKSDAKWSVYDYIMIDGGTALAESLLQQYMQQVKDPRQAYGELYTQFINFINYLKTFKDKTIVVTFQEKYVQDADGRMYHSIDLPGKKLSPQMSYKFDEVLCLRVMQNEENQTVRTIQAQPDLQYTAKDRSGKLVQFEPADLQHVITRMTT